MFKTKLYDPSLGFVRFMEFRSLRLLLNYADKQGFEYIRAIQDDKCIHTCIKDSKKEWYIYETKEI